MILSAGLVLVGIGIGFALGYGLKQPSATTVSTPSISGKPSIRDEINEGAAADIGHTVAQVIAS